ncbi:hypothetical protein QCN29_36320 [Streptomyces sp. HNM0663]|uniref:Uncharacterized protein n=1 Tax=Streptomyces chengmaiensis TaxID=3040919 RepID=A0ABT6HZG4_9ACTN|nr:hypothetical protein [Streptomyces chengmaiensis]MDH2394106.1 hypothetical protein [Streptomyces chengmaiensis]
MSKESSNQRPKDSLYQQPSEKRKKLIKTQQELDGYVPSKKPVRESASNELHRKLHDILEKTRVDKEARKLYGESATHESDWEPQSEADVLRRAVAVDRQSSRAPDLPADTLEEIEVSLKRVRREAHATARTIREWAEPGRLKYARPEAASKRLAGTIDTVKLLVSSPDSADTPASFEREPLQPEEWWAQARDKAKALADCIDEAVDNRSARLGDTPCWDFVIGMLDVWVGMNLNVGHTVLALAAENIMMMDGERREVSRIVEELTSTAAKATSYGISPSGVEPADDLGKLISVSMANRRWETKAQRAETAIEFFALAPS